MVAGESITSAWYSKYLIITGFWEGIFTYKHKLGEEWDIQSKVWVGNEENEIRSG